VSALKYLASRPVAFMKSVHALTAREQMHLRSEMAKVSGLMPLLMKPRNAQRWSHEDKRELVVHLRRLSSISPYLVVLVMPGGMLVLPALAWWLDRRRDRNRQSQAALKRE
jgi:hypothetical protein